MDAPIETHAKTVVGVRFTKVGKLYHFDYDEFPELETGDYVIVDTVRGRQMGQIMGFTTGERNSTYRTITRPATPRDLVLRQHWEAKQADTIQKVREMAKGNREASDDVKFVAAQYNFDGTVLTILYTADQPTEFRKFADQIDRSFSAQVDLRQIGPRDVARLLGGFGACGELQCCSTFLTDFSPISIKMAKMQGISLNPSEITGMCGRLRCCLVYEYEQYVAARKLLPRMGKKIGTPDGKGTVADVHPLEDSVTVYIEESGRKRYHREELIPLAELEALAKKAKEPCSKHGDGECDCGKQPGERRADEIDNDE